MENTYDYDLRSVQEVRDLARLGKIASDQLASYSSEHIDTIVRNMVTVAEENLQLLAQMAVSETGFGNQADKVIKNHLASGILYDAIKDIKTVGIISNDPARKVMEVADPVGLLMGIIPSTNPTATVLFKSIIAIKARNGIVFSPHPSAMECTQKAASLMASAAVEAGAPQNIISCMSLSSLEGTNELMKREEIKMIIATGGPGMVKAAYSSGKPALGVGAGNSPAYIEKTAKVEQAVRNIMASKTFDYGTICASEQSVVTEQSNRDEVIAAFSRQGGYLMTKEETDKVCKLLFKGSGHAMNAKFVGRSPQVIAEAAGISIPDGTRVLLGEQHGVGAGNPLSFEKLTTVLGFYTVKDSSEACQLCIDLLQNGIGHTLSLHTEDPEIVAAFSVKPASRILVNTGSTQGGTGLSTGLAPSLTLGCGTWGGSSISENVGPQHLINVKKVAYGLVDVVELGKQLHEQLAKSKNIAPSSKECAAVSSATYAVPWFDSADQKNISSGSSADQGHARYLKPSTQKEEFSQQVLNISPNSFAQREEKAKKTCGGSSLPGTTNPSAGLENLNGLSSLDYHYSGCKSCSNGVDMGSKPITQEDLADIVASMQSAMRGE